MSPITVCGGFINNFQTISSVWEQFHQPEHSVFGIFETPWSLRVKILYFCHVFGTFGHSLHSVLDLLTSQCFPHTLCTFGVILCYKGLRMLTNTICLVLTIIVSYGIPVLYVFIPAHPHTHPTVDNLHLLPFAHCLVIGTKYCSFLNWLLSLIKMELFLL